MATSSARLAAHVVAHQGGWDEMLLVAGPIVVIIALLAVVKRRVDGAAGDAASRHDDPDRAERGS
ncbi:MAG: hypothetical protein ACRDZZ_13230 [Ilumatobacteraceae bacterium]